jgi:bifunctional non-homologous end joining protein LigD
MAAPKLAAYKAKRDFKLTQEPSGEVAVAASARARFVIQKHDATRLHYDLRLEHEGVFLSWAVTKGPSRSARQAAGGPGRGPPAGLWRLRGHDPPRPVRRRHGDAVGPRLVGARAGLRPGKGLKKGEIKLVFAGERLKGGWVLVRINNDRQGAAASARTGC